MQFNGEQLSAIYKLAHLMVMADGVVDERELACISAELISFGVTPEQLKPLTAAALTMLPSKAIEIVSNFDAESKKYVASYLGTIMAIDGDIDDREMALWCLISQMCSLPTMSIADAITNMKELHYQ